MAQVYKSFTPEQAKSRPTTALSNAQKAQVKTILNNFVVYLKAKHT